MSDQAFFFADLASQAKTPEAGILSRTLYQDEQVKVVLFAFDAGQELSEHTASVPAHMLMVRGEATWTLGDEVVEAAAGSWTHMPAGLKHAIQARTPAVLLLTMLRGGASQGPDRP